MKLVRANAQHAQGKTPTVRTFKEELVSGLFLRCGLRPRWFLIQVAGDDLTKTEQSTHYQLTVFPHILSNQEQPDLNNP